MKHINYIQFLLVTIGWICISTLWANDSIPQSKQETANTKHMTFYDFNAKSIDGEMIKMDHYKGKVVLIVNTASKCGFTPQYEGLEKLYKKYKEKGLVILGFPCNQFLEQEPGSENEIKTFCTVNYGVTFPMFAKIEVNGDNTHPLFKYLKKEMPGNLNNSVKWNFTKFLIDRSGKPIERFAPQTKPEELENRIILLLDSTAEEKK